MSSFTNPDKDYKLWVLLYQSRDHVMRVRENELQNFGISTVEAGTLYVIKAIGRTEGKVTPAKIAKGMIRQHHTVTALLKRMEKKGLITRIKDPDNKGALIIELTEKGEIARQQSKNRDSLHRVMSVFSEDEKDQFEEYLFRLRDNAIRQSLEIPNIIYDL
ncbi:MAG TPA: MarR family transcriptional regulator [Dehalococcoidia bacterium]|nr:MarR family transcriptional regulator [Dehalococcoidia bacterium]